MAICRDNKYSLNELQRFTDRIENVLSHDVCRQEYRTFLKEIRRFDLVRILDLWELANDIRRNTPGSPERRRKAKELEEKVEDEPSLSGLLDDSASIVTAVNERTAEKLGKNHRYFIHYLTRKYR